MVWIMGDTFLISTHIQVKLYSKTALYLEYKSFFCQSNPYKLCWTISFDGWILAGVYSNRRWHTEVTNSFRILFWKKWNTAWKFLKCNIQKKFRSNGKKMRDFLVLLPFDAYQREIPHFLQSDKKSYANLTLVRWVRIILREGCNLFWTKLLIQWVNLC